MDIKRLEQSLRLQDCAPKWYVDQASLEDYKGLGSGAVVGGILTAARNMALNIYSTNCYDPPPKKDWKQLHRSHAVLLGWQCPVPPGKDAGGGRKTGWRTPWYVDSRGCFA